MQKKKILFVVHQLNYGGVQKAAISALNAIDYTENEVTLYVRKNRTQLLPSVNKNVSKIIINEDSTCYYRRPYMIYIEICKKLAKLFKNEEWQNDLQQKEIAYINKSKMEYEEKHYFQNKQEYDIAVSYISGFTAQFVAEYVSAKKKVMFYHASTDENHELHERIMPQFDKIVGVNENVQKILEELYPKFKDKMMFVENYVDAEEIRERSKEYDIPAKDGRFVLCSCGRMASVKGFNLAVEAAEILKEKGIAFAWYFVGDGPEREKIETQIQEKGLTEYIEITGMQDNPYPYIAGCDIYVQPSYEEAHPLSIIEALILCHPVVSTATVGGRALVKQDINGRISDINGESLAEAIEYMIKTPEEYYKMTTYLNKIDYSKDWERYQQSWVDLLEGK